jgi:uncharacterized protein YeaO (DUF488 family)
MSIKFLYLDDEEKERVEPFAQALSSEDMGLEVMFENPKEYSNQIDELTKGNFDGLILDWRLDLIPVIDGESVRYRASTLTQEIRGIASEKHELEVPIVLLSTFDKLRQSYERDETSHDLFDKIYLKEKVGEQAQQISKELCALVKGYHRIIAARNKKFPFYKILDIEEEDAGILDIRIQDIFSGDEPAHKYAQFIFKELIDVPGPLIDEFILAARLGVDIEKSGDWENLKVTFLDSFSYKGPFGEVWPRWWSILLEKWWETLEGSSEPLPFLNAKERVEILRKNTKLESLLPAELIEKEYSSKFWTICQVRKRPLDPIDGFMLQSRGNFPWQERLYVSKIAALKREHIAEGLKIHPFDRESWNDYIEEMDSQANV